MIRILFCWAEVNGYMAASWRALARTGKVQVSIVAGCPGSLDANNLYSTDITSGLDVQLLDAKQYCNSSIVLEAVVSRCPDIVFIPGWMNPAFSALPFNNRLKGTKFIMGFDNPRMDNWRQHFARLKVGRLVDRMDLVVVTGERSWQFAKGSLGVPEKKIVRALYGVNFQALAMAMGKREALVSGWPKCFVFMGRMVEIKGVDLLTRAYTEYRRMVKSPWPIFFCGNGPLKRMIKDQEGMNDAGFIQPLDLPEFLASMGVLVLPSRMDPWPLTIVEAASAGLPIVCTNACGSAVEVVRHYISGLLVPTESIGALTEALCWMHDNHTSLPEMGRYSQSLARPYSAENWAIRWLHIATDLL